ncbi:hypothetical protein C8R43DRAFT_961570 [Mycena crocata]|nr:hypothetical protein C8R43DRAFT_961570 [Mycena crocata]
MAAHLDFDSLATYVELIRLMKPYLSAQQPYYRRGPPETLPIPVHDFLKLCLGLTDDIAKITWEQMRTTAWSRDFTATEELAARTKHIELFLQHGLSRNIGVYSLQPPTGVCIDPACAQSLLSDPSALHQRELVEPSVIPVTIFTKEFGSVPGFATSRYCRKCNTRYHPNYTANGQTRTHQLPATCW